MDSNEQELFRRAVAHASATHTGAALDDALAELGWSDALASDERAAVSTLFELQGRENATSSAIEVVLANAGATEVARREPRGLDSELRMVELVGPPEAIAAGRRAIAYELIGASRAMLELARVHALDRVQFGRPIAQFQAVRHRLADAFVAIEGAAAAVEAAWDGDDASAAAAKALAGNSARAVARHAQQVLAGIGFTAEHRLHLYLRRALVLDRFFGDAQTLTRRLGEQIIAARSLPPMLPL